MRKPFLEAAVLVLLAPVVLAGSGAVRPFEAGAGAATGTPIDAPILAALRRKGLSPAPPCSDAVFVRRAFLDVIGTLPEPRETLAFLEDRSPGKRAALVDALMEREEFADLWSLKWCDLLRVKSEFPVNLWPNAVQAYHRWIRDAVRSNLPYDRFARDLLTASGSSFRDPPVNFWRAVQGRDPRALSSAVALTFMGTRVERWPEERRAGMAAFFSRLAYKRTDEWKEEIVGPDPAPPAGPVAAIFPDGRAVEIPAGVDPRRVFADWLASPANPWFARAVANRACSWLLGRGAVEEPDDLRPDNPPSVPGLLEVLEKELVLSGWDLRHLFRVILGSRAYGQSSIPRGNRAEAAALFGAYRVRRLDAEVLADALRWIGGDGEGWTSAIPEPWSLIPGSERAATLADGSVTNQFLEIFGRPARDTGLESERSCRPTAAQRLHLLNSTEVQRLLSRSPRLRRVLEEARGKRTEIVRGLYLVLLSRHPTEEEADTAEGFLARSGGDLKSAIDDLAWALVNGREFLHRH